MLNETDLVSKRLVTDVARERPLPVVRPPRVHLQTVRGAEYLVTLQARVNISSAQGQRAELADGSARSGRTHCGGDLNKVKNRRIEPLPLCETKTHSEHRSKSDLILVQTLTDGSGGGGKT